MNSIADEFRSMFTDIKDMLINIGKEIYSFLSSIVGEQVTNLFLIAVGALLIILLIIKFINRD
ncbi:MAG: hypothetical protein ACI31M_00520 [Bacilli bacterium]